VQVQFGQLGPFGSRTGSIGNFAIRDNAGCLHGAELLFFRESGLHSAPEEFRLYDRQIEIGIMRNDGRCPLYIGIELQEHFVQRDSLCFRPLGRDAVNSCRVHRDGEVCWIDDETVPAFPVPVAVVERPGQLDYPGPFFGIGCCGVSGEAGGFGVNEKKYPFSFIDNGIWVCLF
jgi:hypothetical protein